MMHEMAYRSTTSVKRKFLHCCCYEATQIVRSNDARGAVERASATIEDSIGYASTILMVL